MTNIVQKLTRGGYLVLHVSAGALWTVKACLMFPSNRRSAFCEMDQECARNALPPLLLVCPRQALNPNSDICVSGAVESYYLVYVASEGCNIARLRPEQCEDQVDTSVLGGIGPSFH